MGLQTVRSLLVMQSLMHRWETSVNNLPEVGSYSPLDPSSTLVAAMYWRSGHPSFSRDYDDLKFLSKLHLQQKKKRSVGFV